MRRRPWSQELREVTRWGAAVTVQAWVRGAAARRHVGGGRWERRRRRLLHLHAHHGVL